MYKCRIKGTAFSSKYWINLLSGQSLRMSENKPKTAR